MDHTARNFHAHGGSEWVVGGKLTFLPGATVEGAEGLFDLPPWRRSRFALYRGKRSGNCRRPARGLQRPAARAARGGPHAGVLR